MRRPSKRSTVKLSADSQRLIMLAQAIMQASSRVEERAWEHDLDFLLQKLLRTHHQETVDAALEHAFRAQPAIYELLMETVEAVSESCEIEHEGKTYQALLVAAPILAWTRFAIPSGAIPAESVATLSALLGEHVLAPDVQLAMAPTLYAIDQLPRTHADTYALTHRLAEAALKKTATKALAANAPETIPFLADTRYLLAVVAAPVDQPLFKWQTELSAIGHEQVLSRWKLHARSPIEQLMPGCGADLLLPEAYFAACREGDKEIRPHSIQAAIHYLTNTLDLDPSDLQVVVGGFGEDTYNGQIDEYRISFLIRQEPEVIYGVIWPLYDQEEDEPSDTAMITTTAAMGEFPSLQDLESVTPLNEIVLLLKQCGIAHIKRHSGCFPMENCEDCGAPLYLDLEGELVHTEMPEDAPQEGKEHFH